MSLHRSLGPAIRWRSLLYGLMAGGLAVNTWLLGMVYWLQRSLFLEAGQTLATQTEILNHGAQEVLRDQVRQLQLLASQGNVQDRLPQRPLPSADLRQRWGTLPLTDRQVQALINHSLASPLQRYKFVTQYGSNLVITDRQGTAIASTDKPPLISFNQETWFQKWRDRWQQGTTDAYIGAAITNDGGKTWFLPIAVPVRSNNQMVGMVWTAYPLIYLWQLVSNNPAFNRETVRLYITQETYYQGDRLDRAAPPPLAADRPFAQEGRPPRWVVRAAPLTLTENGDPLPLHLWQIAPPFQAPFLLRWITFGLWGGEIISVLALGAILGYNRQHHQQINHWLALSRAVQNQIFDPDDWPEAETSEWQPLGEGLRSMASTIAQREATLNTQLAQKQNQATQTAATDLELAYYRAIRRRAERVRTQHIPLSQIKAILQQVRYFQHLPPDSLNRLIALSQRYTYEAGEILCEEGVPGQMFYIVLRGAVEVVAPKLQRSLGRLGPGDYFGELSIVSDSGRTATIQASLATTLLGISKQDFRRLMNSDTQMAILVEQELERYRDELTSRQADLIAQEQERSWQHRFDQWMHRLLALIPDSEEEGEEEETGEETAS